MSLLEEATERTEHTVDETMFRKRGRGTETGNPRDRRSRRKKEVITVRRGRREEEEEEAPEGLKQTREGAERRRDVVTPGGGLRHKVEGRAHTQHGGRVDKSASGSTGDYHHVQ